MKSSPLVTVLYVGVCLLAGVVLLLAIGYEWHYRQLRKVQPQVFVAQNYQNVVNALANDALEYSKHNPAIDSILQPVGVKAGRPSTPAAKTGGK